MKGYFTDVVNVRQTHTPVCLFSLCGGRRRSAKDTALMDVRLWAVKGPVNHPCQPCLGWRRVGCVMWEQVSVLTLWCLSFASSL